MFPMGPPEGKILAINIVSQNRQITLKNQEILRKFEKTGSIGSYESSLEGRLLEKKLLMLTSSIQ